MRFFSLENTIECVKSLNKIAAQPKTKTVHIKTRNFKRKIRCFCCLPMPKQLFNSSQLYFHLLHFASELSIKSCLSLNKQLNCGRMWMRHDLFPNCKVLLTTNGKKPYKKSAQENNFRLLIRLPWHYVFWRQNLTLVKRDAFISVARFRMKIYSMRGRHL